MDRINSKRRINILLSGPDGSGKSTIAKGLLVEFEKKREILSYHWLRFNHYTSKIVNLIGRISGKSYYETYSWGKQGYHEYTGLLGYLYVTSNFFDFILFKYALKRFKISRSKSSVIDRYIIDLIADLIVDTERNDLIYFLFGSHLTKELKVNKAFILICNKNIVLKRRRDIVDDKFYDRKVEAYLEVATKFGIPLLDTGLMTANETVTKIVQEYNRAVCR